MQTPRDQWYAALLVAALAVPVLAQNPPSCVITSPASGATVSEAVTFDFAISDPDLDPMTVFWEFSTDVGTTYWPMTAAVTSATGNPAFGLPDGAYTFTWDSCLDATLAGTPGVFVRLAVDDGLFTAVCLLFIHLDNGPACTITSPIWGVYSGVIPIDFNSDQRCSTILQGEAWVQTVPGGPYFLATPASGTNPFTLTTGPATFLWSSVADVSGFAASVQFSIVVLASPGSTTCMTSFDVDNSLCTTFCGDCDSGGTGPDILDAFEAGRIAVGVVLPTTQQSACCDVDSSGIIDVLDAFQIALSAVGIPVTLACP